MNKIAQSPSARVPDGILLFAHGSRDPLWKRPIEAVAAQIALTRPELPVACAYLELCEPSLADAASNMISQLQTNAIKNIAATAYSTGTFGQNHLKIRVLPMFLGMGKHAREDLPELATQLRSAHPEVEFEIAPAVGEDGRVTQLLATLAIA
jgi:sirohydrochlorin cobaltochelatase